MCIKKECRWINQSSTQKNIQENYNTRKEI
nr:MAG TPA: hypothetical protein [Caudoviricetes sp.]